MQSLHLIMTSSKRRVSIAYFCYLKTVPPNRDVFCKGYDYGEKVDLSKGYWNPKRKMWVTTHFSEIIK